MGRGDGEGRAPAGAGDDAATGPTGGPVKPNAGDGSDPAPQGPAREARIRMGRPGRPAPGNGRGRAPPTARP